MLVCIVQVGMGNFAFMADISVGKIAEMAFHILQSVHLCKSKRVNDNGSSDPCCCYIIRVSELKLDC